MAGAPVDIYHTLGYDFYTISCGDRKDSVTVSMTCSVLKSGIVNIDSNNINVATGSLRIIRQISWIYSMCLIVDVIDGLSSRDFLEASLCLSIISPSPRYHDVWDEHSSKNGNGDGNDEQFNECKTVSFQPALLFM